MNRPKAITAFLLTAAVCVTSVIASPALAASTSALSNATALNVASASTGFAAASPRVPLVDSQFGVGASLVANTATAIPLGLTASAGVTSALVRVSLFAPATAVQLQAAGAPALAVDANESASTTLLVPLAEGSVVLSATGDVDLRVEVLATYTSSTAPGEFTTLPTPITRTDTPNGLGGDELTTEPTWFGVTGSGGVPSLNVRAAMVTASVTVGAPTSLLLGGQSIDLATGTTVITTVAPVTAEGEVDIAVASGTAAARVDVRAYVVGAAQNDSALSVSGSYVPTDDVTAVVLEVDDEAKTPVSLPDDLSALADAAYSLVLVEAAPAAQTTVLSIGSEIKGRATGVVVDPASGTQAQLALIPVGAVAEVRRGSTDVSLQRLGDIVAASPATSTDLAISLDSPTTGSTVDLTDLATFTLDGTVTSATASLDAVRVYSGTTLVGTAEVDYQQGRSSWTFELAVPASGAYEFRAEVSDRAGTTASDTINLTVTLPGADEVLLSTDTNVVPDDVAASMVSATDTSLTFGVDPGYVPGDIVIGLNETVAPEGFIRRVVSVQETTEGWILTTINASLVEAIRQGDVDDVVNLVDVAGTTVTRPTGPSPDDTPGLITVPGDVEDLTMFDSSTSRRATASNPNFTLDEGIEAGVEAKATFTWAPDDVQKDLSRSDPATTNAAAVEFEASGGAILEGKVSLGFALNFVLKIDIVWAWLPNSEVVEFSTILTRSTEASLTGHVWGSADLSIEKALADYEFPSIKFMVGPVPVWITSGVELGFIGELHADASFEATWGIRTIQDYGFRYSGGRFRDVSTDPRTTNTLPVFGDGAAWEGNATAAIGPTAVVQVSIYDAAGPIIEGAGTLGLDFAADEVGMDFEAYLEGNVSIGVQLKFPVIDEVLLSATVAEFASDRWILVKWSTTWDEIFNGTEPTEPGDGDEGGEGGVSDPNMPRPNPAPEFNASDLRVTLYWNNKSDMDLHLVEPDGTEIFYSNPGPTATQGQLDIDSNSNCRVERPNEPGGIENIYWPNGISAPVGNYTISVDRYSGCNLPDAQWIVEVWNGADLVLRQTGNNEQAFTINVKDLSNARSAGGAAADSADAGSAAAGSTDRVTVTDLLPVPITVGIKE
jgi:hypothetical protein